jgi:hypothetical protein
MKIEVVIKDTMSFWDSYLETYVLNPNAPSLTNTYVFDVPDAWVANGALTEAAIERVCAYLYGESWKLGNGDGSRYVVLEQSSRVLPADDARTAKPLS